MPDKALISELTWRTLEMQRKAFPDMPHYIAPDELDELFRPTTRKTALNVHVVSEAVIADTERAFRAFLVMMRSMSAWLCVKGKSAIRWTASVDEALVQRWRISRREGAAKAGGIAKANRDERLFWGGFSKIADRWHLPAKKENASQVLLEEADTSRNTVRSYLGHTREEWQRLTQAKRERILKGKINVEAN